MYLGRTYQDVIDNIKPLFPHYVDDLVIVAMRKGLWLLTLKQAAYIKYHVARLEPIEVRLKLSEEKRSQIYFSIKLLRRKGVL